jgi:hypothetical protein
VATEPLNGNRVQAWKDTLSSDELIEVQRLESMPPQMAVAYVYVEFKRQMSGKRSLMSHVGSGMGGAFVVVAGLFAHVMGWDKVVR